MTATTSTTPSPPIPVDRDWIDKLLKKYPNPKSRLPILSNRNDGNETTTTTTTTTNDNDNDNDSTTTTKIKALVVAPMVDQSDLPFRLLCRKYGANLCFTPMVHAKLVVTSPMYRKKFIGNFILQDRPLIAQICGSDPEIVLQAARYLEPHVDGIDINCGCPQGIAKRGNYGAYLLEQEEELLTLIRFLIPRLKVPLSVKVRLLPSNTVHEGGDGVGGNDCYDMDDDDDVVDGYNEEDDQKLQVGGGGGATAMATDDDKSASEENNYHHDNYKNIAKCPISQQKSLELYTKLVDAGIHLLTIHGRTRHEKGPQKLRNPDWETIRRAVDLLGHRIPIFANGGIETFQDVQDCLSITNADGIMSSESVLEYPPIFYNSNQSPQQQEQEEEEKASNSSNSGSEIRTVGRLQLAQEYMDLARQYPPELGGQGSGLKCIRIHIHRFLHADLQSNPEIRDLVVRESTVEGLQCAIDQIRAFRDEAAAAPTPTIHDITKEQLSWYRRHRRSPEEKEAEARCLAEYVAKRRGEEVKEEVEAADCSSFFFAAVGTAAGNDDEGDY